MPTGTNLEAQLGVKQETTAGVPVTVDRFYPFISESLRTVRPVLTSYGQIQGHVLPMASKQGTSRSGGSINMGLFGTAQARLWGLALGSVSTTGSGPYTHTATIATALPSFTTQVGFSSTSAVHAKTYAGCKVAAVKVSAARDQPAELSLDVVAMTESTDVALASASFTDNAAVPLVLSGVTVDGNAVACESVSFTVTHPLRVRDLVGAGAPMTAKRAGFSTVSGQLTVELEDLAEYGQYVTATRVPVAATFSNGTSRVTITAKTTLTGNTPTVSGTGITKHDLTFDDAFGAVSDTDGFVVTVVDATSS